MSEDADNDAHPETCPSLCVERSHPGREHDPATDGCHCWRPCAMGPTCPGANAGLRRGCWRVTTPALRDGIAGERRATIIEALAWWEDADGRWGYEKARDVLAAHEAEWCGVSGARALVGESE